MENINIYPDQDIQIMGARSQPNFKDGPFTHSSERNLVALNSTTKEPMSVFWIYEGESTGVHSSSFRDTKPFKSLLALKSAVRLQPSNISTSYEAFTAITNDGSACGFNYNGQKVSYSQPERNHDIHMVGNFSSAPAFINKQGQILSPIELPEDIAALNDVIDVTSGHFDSVILRGNGSLVYWEHDAKTYVGPPPAEIANLNDIIAIKRNGFSVAVLRSGGQVMAWGRPKNGRSEYGSDVPADIAALTDIVKLWYSVNSYIAQRRNGQLVAWGADFFSSARIPPAIAKLTDIIHVTTSLNGAAALRANGQVVGWGIEANNTPPQNRPWTVVPDEIAKLTDIIDVQALPGPSFAALRRNGTVVIWGVLDSSWVPSDLTDVVAITGAAGSVAALKKDGTVTVFGGNSFMMSSWQKVKHLLVDVKAVYSSSDRFIALTANGQVITWSSWSSKQLIPEELQGKVSYQQ